MKLSLKSKTILTLVSILLSTGAGFYLLVNYQISNFMKSSISRELDSIIKIGYRLLDTTFPGEWSLIEGQLYKGDILMENNYIVVDEIKRDTGALATIFKGDTRVSTNVTTESGSRAVGTKAAPEVTDRVLRQGKDFSGEAMVVGKLFQTQYTPLKDTNGKVIGMWFVGIAKDDIKQRITKIQWLIGFCILGVILLGTVIAIVFSRSITDPILTAVDGLTKGIYQINSSSNQLSLSSQQLAEGSAGQSTSLEETASTLQESTAMIRQNTENTKQAALLADQTKEAVAKGNREMEEMTESMNEIKKSSGQISKVIKVIDDIAFQTNILALNAAVEAARAGEAGLGFAVVADEVRNLAQRSAEAAQDTAAMIENNIELSEKGVKVTQRVRETLNEVTVQAKKISEIMAEIAAASQEQSQGISQINSAIAQMETAVQQNASYAEENAAAAEALSAQAQNLKKIVQQLMVLVHGAIDQKHERSLRDGQTSNLAKETHKDYRSSGTKQVPYLGKPVSHLPDKRSRLVSPEDIIPLDQDNQF